MKRYSGLLIAVFLLLVLVLPTMAQEDGPPHVGIRPDAPEYALHGPYWVGTRHLPAASTDLHPTRVEVWYPAQNPEELTEDITFLEYDLPIIGHALQDAAQDVEHGPYPLVIVAHGFNGNRQDFLYLCENLASHGFVVLAITYADAWATPAENAGARVLTQYSRPSDVSWQIDYAVSLTASGGAMEGMIDTEHVAVVGHSLGGYTALMAAGARLDIDGPTSWCTNYPDTTLPEEIGGFNLCHDIADNKAELAERAGLEAAPDELWPSWGDDRVDAIVPLAPTMLLFGSESLQTVPIPAMIMYGSIDDFVFTDNPLYRSYIYETLESPMKSLVVFENAGHVFFGNDCDVQPWLYERGLFWICSDLVWDEDRAHDLINHFTTAFLLDVLKGDEAAHAALAPDAVSFPGVTYQAEGF